MCVCVCVCESALLHTNTSLPILFSLSLPPILYTHDASLPPSLTLSSLQQVLISQPRNTEALYNQALAFYRHQNLQKAEENFLKLLAISPSHKDGLYYLGHTYYKGQKFDHAVEVWRKLDRNYRDVAAQLKMAEKHSSRK